MREKKDALIITFSTTAEAMKTEKYCEKNGFSGRLIPVPREITAGCGLAWKAAPQEMEQLPKSLSAAGIHWEEARILKI
ncbi:MAG: DUF3343 domain-containing protein [Blautia sp.]|nr:DUF3343 domain-containing protein [Blautia sp.]